MTRMRARGQQLTISASQWCVLISLLSASAALLPLHYTFHHGPYVCLATLYSGSGVNSVHIAFSMRF